MRKLSLLDLAAWCKYEQVWIFKLDWHSKTMCAQIARQYSMSWKKKKKLSDNNWEKWKDLLRGMYICFPYFLTKQTDTFGFGNTNDLNSRRKIRCSSWRSEEDYHYLRLVLVSCYGSRNIKNMKNCTVEPFKYIVFRNTLYL